MTTPSVECFTLRKLCPYRILTNKYWFLTYKWRENLSGDLVAGLTMAIIQIPQGIRSYILFIFNIFCIAIA